MSVERHFISWHRPIPAAVADFLLPEDISGPVNLASTLIVVPTRQAGRRLREALALRCAGHNGAILSARIVPPSFLFRSDSPATRETSPTVAAAVWADVILKAGRSACPALLPARNPQPDFAWSLSMAETVQDLRETLAEGGLRLADVPAAAGETLEEPERWRDLANLESLYLQRLASLGYSDSCLEKIRRAGHPEIPDGVTRIVIAAVPDPAPLAIRALETLSRHIDVIVLVAAPPDMADGFDPWGRPAPSRWTTARIAVPDPESNILLAGNPARQSRRVLEVLAAHSDRFGPVDIAIGVPDRTVIPFLEADFAEHGLCVFDPQDKPTREHPLFHLLESYADFVTTRSYSSFRNLIRQPAVLRWLSADHQLAPLDVLRELDEIQNQRLPLVFYDIEQAMDAGPSGSLSSDASRDDAHHTSTLARAIPLFRTLLAGDKGSSVTSAVRSFLQTVFASSRVDRRNADDNEFIAMAAHIDSVLRDLDESASAGIELTPADTLRLALRSLSGLALHRDPTGSRIDLQGWLELPWDDAPLLIVTGMNEGCVPGGRISDAYLPDALRLKLGLRSDEVRLARDSFLMRFLVESRKTSGLVCFIAGKNSATGDPLKPSRLLFRCPDDELPERVRRLFGLAADLPEDHPASVSFRLSSGPPADVPPDRLTIGELHVTAFRDYLDCPFRFYLTHILDMEPLDDQKTELDPADFGTLLHAALRDMAASATMRTCDDETKLARFLGARVESHFHALAGPSPSLPLLIALDSARQRLHAAAAVQAALIRDGWKILHHEKTCRLSFHGITVVGKIDRVDRHVPTGRIRIIDYKTSDKAESPEQAHLGSPKTSSAKTPGGRRKSPTSAGHALANADRDLGESLPDFSLVTVSGRMGRWIDLQLPLYRLLLQSNTDLPDPVELAYFNLPRAVTETAVSVWDGADGELFRSAEQCAAAVVERIRKRVFWPPAEEPRYDSFEVLFPGAPEQCVEPPNVDSRP